MFPILRRATPWLAVLLVVMVATFGNPFTKAKVLFAQNDEDQPVLVTDDFFEDWTFGAGLIWWSQNCFTDERPVPATLHRRSAFGGVAQTVLSTDTHACDTFHDQLSLQDGLYYFNRSGSSIEKLPPSATQAQTVKDLTPQQFPIIPLVDGGDYIYWLTGNRTILRTLKDGSGDIQTVANTAATPQDFIVVGLSVYWTDSTGLWAAGTVCDTMPCSAIKFADLGANTTGYGLLYRHFSSPPPFHIGSYSVYWVQAHVVDVNTTTYSINYKTCRDDLPCVDQVISPGSVSDAGAHDPQLFYQAADNERIGDLVLDGITMFWTEALKGDASTGDVRTTFIGNDQSPEIIATGQGGIQTSIFVDTDFTHKPSVYFSRTTSQGTAIYSLPTDAGPIRQDIQGVSIEVTQGIQKPEGGPPFSVDLVADKPTVVRAYANLLSGPNAPSVEAVMRGEVNSTGQPLPGSPLLPLNHVIGLTTGDAVNRGDINASWNFLLPASWLHAGRITLFVDIDPRHLHFDPNPNNNGFEIFPNFKAQAPVCVMTVPVRTNTPLPSTDDPNFWAMISQFQRRWPTPAAWIFRDPDPEEELQICSYGPFPYPCNGPYELDENGGTFSLADRDKVLVSLVERELLTDDPDECDDVNATTHYMGMVYPDAPTAGYLSYASRSFDVSWVKLPPHDPDPQPVAWDQGIEGRAMAQAFGLNAGRKFVDCQRPPGVEGSDVDFNYPYPTCQLDRAPILYYGFDIPSRQPIDPLTTGDFMSFSSRAWVSDYTWRALFDVFYKPDAASAASTNQPVANGQSVIVTGLVDTNTVRGEISSLLVVTTTELPPSTVQKMSVQAASVTNSNVKLHLLDSKGALLTERTLTLTPVDSQGSGDQSAYFTDLFAAPSQQVATVQLLIGSTVVDTHTVGAHKPVVAIQQPAAGAVIDNDLTIAWTASDADQGDRLLFTVQYSDDHGNHWHTIAVNQPGGPDADNSLHFTDLGSLHGSANNNALIRVLASDGYNTTIATSQGFTLKNRRPEPIILTPTISETFAAGEAVILQGNATDAEDGGLSDNALQWQVDNGTSVTGTTVAVPGLAPGTHVAALTATDSDHQSANTQVSFKIAPLSIPLGAAPELDGFCEDNVYSQTTSIQLAPYKAAFTPEGFIPPSVRVLRSDDYLWVCFSGLRAGSPDSDSQAVVSVEVNNSHDGVAQSSDIAFFATSSGGYFSRVGDGHGDFGAQSGQGINALVSGSGNEWEAELRIDKSSLGGWDHLVGMSFAHYSDPHQTNDPVWPFAAQWAKPNTWATTALGIQPVIEALTPSAASSTGATTASDLASSLTITVEGSDLVSGTTVLWNGAALPTTHVDDEHLTAKLSSAQLGSAGRETVTTRSPAPGAFVSNPLSFVVEGSTPQITSLSPVTVTAGGAALTLTINGHNFASDAEVLWNDTELPAQFVNSGKLTVVINSTLTEVGQQVGVAIANPTPDERISPDVPFTVEPNLSQPTQPQQKEKLYLPSTKK